MTKRKQSERKLKSEHKRCVTVKAGVFYVVARARARAGGVVRLLFLFPCRLRGRRRGSVGRVRRCWRAGAAGLLAGGALQGGQGGPRERLLHSLVSEPFLVELKFGSSTGRGAAVRLSLAALFDPLYSAPQGRRAGSAAKDRRHTRAHQGKGKRQNKAENGECRSVAMLTHCGGATCTVYSDLPSQPSSISDLTALF